MIRLILLLLVIFQISLCFQQYARIHYSDIAKLKCDALPFRTAYKSAHCFFAISDRMTASEADATCGRLFAGAVLGTNVESAIWNKLGVNRSLYHRNSASTENLRVLCVYSNDFNCDQDTVSTIPGKCTIKAEKQMTYDDAANFCARRLSDLPTITNDAENQLVTAEIGVSSMWVAIGYNKKWSDPNRSFGRFASCKSADKKNILLAAETPSWCPIDTAVAVDPDGYWAFRNKSTKLDVLCVRNATNEFYTESPRSSPTLPPTTPRSTVKTTAKPTAKVSGATAKPTGATGKPPGAINCIAMHKFSTITGKCEWSGASNGCVQLTNDKGKTMELTIANFPTNRKANLNLWTKTKTIADFNDVTVSAIVRNGCFATFFENTNESPVKPNPLLFNKGYGSYKVPSIKNGMLTKLEDGLSRVACDCPIKKAPIKPITCKALHRFNKENGKCEWTGPANACAQLINHKNQSMFVQIEDWPFKQGIEIDLWKPNSWMTKFNDVTVRTVVRLGCMATYYMHTTGGKYNQEARLLTNVRYGVHSVPSTANKRLKIGRDGLTRVYCVCDRYGVTLTKRGPPTCAESHKLNTKTGICEWTGPSNGCVEIINNKKERMFMTIQGYPKTTRQWIDLYKAKNYAFNDHTVKGIVRNGCRATFYAHTTGERQIKLVHNKGYGTYNIPCKDTGTLKNARDGLTRIYCRCEDKMIHAVGAVAPVQPVTGILKCAEHHAFNNKTKRCEWTQKPEYCGQITNDAGKKAWLTIPNWSTNRRYDVNYWTSKMYEFNDRIVRIVVRQHCFALLDPGFNRREYATPIAYGAWGVPSFFNPKQKTKTKELGVTRIRCECIY